MLRRGAAFAFAACILVWPAGAGSDTDTFWSAPSAAVLGAIPVRAIESALDPYQQQIAKIVQVAPAEQSAGKNQVAMQNTSRADTPAPPAARDQVETKIAPSPALPSASQPALAPAQRQIASAAAEMGPPINPTAKTKRKRTIIRTSMDRRERRNSIRRNRRSRRRRRTRGTLRPHRDARLVRTGLDQVARRRSRAFAPTTKSARMCRDDTRLAEGRAEFSRHRRAGPRPDRARPHRRHQSRGQHGD